MVVALTNFIVTTLRNKENCEVTIMCDLRPSIASECAILQIFTTLED